MAKQLECPTCGAAMRDIIWGYGTIADVADAGDAVIGGCVVDVDRAGRVAALQCPVCGTRADERGIALEQPTRPAVAEHPFAVVFSDPQPERQEVMMTEHANAANSGEPAGADGSPFVDDDFGGIAAGGDWRDRVMPYASRDDQLPQPSARHPDHVEPYASRADALPDRTASSPSSVEPYASRDDELPEGVASTPDRVDPYASREDQVPEGGGEWREHIDPFAADPGSQGVPGEAIDSHSLDTSDFTDAEEEGWPSRDDE